METRHQIKKHKLDEENRKKREEDFERAKTMFVRKDNLIRKNDIVTDPPAKKIKLEHEMPVVKQDVESGERFLQSVTLDEPVIVTMEVQEEVTENKESEEGTELVTVEEKVDLSGMDNPSAEASSWVSSLRNVASTIETLQKEKEELKTLLNTRNSKNGNLNAQLAQNDVEIENLKALLKEKDTKIGNLNVQLEHRDVENKILAEQRTLIEANLESEIKTGENLKEILLEKDEEIGSQNNIIQSLRLQLEKVTEVLAEKTAEVTSQTKISESLRSQIGKMKEMSKREIPNSRVVLQKETMNDGEINVNLLADEVMETTTGDDGISSGDKVIQLFPDVVKVFIQHQGKFNWLVYWRKVISTLKTCRLICKSWKQSVDFILEQDSSHISLLGTENYALRFTGAYTPLPLLFPTLSITDPSTLSLNLQKFLQHSEKMAPSYNPIPTRHLMITYDTSCGNDSSLWEIVLKFLQQFGKQVWYLTLKISTGKTLESVKLTIEILRDVLELLPNIRSLAIQILNWHDCEVDEPGLNQPTFPHLKHLETFLCDRNVDLFNCVLATNQHIRRLEFCEDSIMVNSGITNSPMRDINFQNLEEVMWHVRTEAWQKIVNANLKLKTLILNIVSKKSHRNSIESLMQGLENVGKTLKFLTLHLPQAEEGMFVDGKVTLPQLRGLHIVSRDWKPKNWERFLAQLENLESFTLQLVQNRQPSTNEKKEFVEYINSFQDKTHWAKFPELKVFSLIVFIRLVNKSMQRIENTFQVTVKRSKNDVLRFNLVKIDEKELDEMLAC